MKTTALQHTSGIKWVHHHTWLCPLPSSSMFRWHCELTLQGFRRSVEDNSTGNSTTMNGLPLPQAELFNVILWIQYPEPRQWKEALVAVSMKGVHERYEKNSNTWLWSVDYSRQTGVWWVGMKRVHDSLFVKGMWKPSFADTYSAIYSPSCIKFDADWISSLSPMTLRPWHLFSIQMLICEFTSQNFIPNS